MIGVFDSGVGGLSVLRELFKLLPDERYVYYADTAHCPYGQKSKEYIIDRAREITRFLLDKGCDIIVIACNTATSAAIKTLRKELPDVPFVGIEPAVKPAAFGSRNNVVGVLATAGTLKGGSYLDLIERYSTKADVVESIGRGFVELVESGDFSSPHAEAVVRAAVEPLLNAHADNLVLGCTHYPFLTDMIAKVAGPGVKIINPAPAVAQQAQRMYKPKNKESFGLELCTSGDQAQLERMYKTLIG